MAVAPTRTTEPLNGQQLEAVEAKKEPHVTVDSRKCAIRIRIARAKRAHVVCRVVPYLMLTLVLTLVCFLATVI